MKRMHYLSFAKDMKRRIDEHKSGKSGIRLVEAAVKAGCVLEAVERSLKGRVFDPHTQRTSHHRGSLVSPRGLEEDSSS